jgi:flagellar biosynthesis chaperone FliJ
MNVTNRRDEHERDVDERDVNVKNDDKIDIDVEAERDVDVERSSTMTTSTFTCDICGKEFNSENSLKFHKIRVHKVGSEKPERGESKPKPKYEQEESVIPDPYHHLKNMLIVFGVNERNANAIVEYMKPYSVDDLYKLVEACQTYMPRSTLKLFVESWANIRHTPIPPEIAERLDINMPPSSSYTGYSRRPRYEGEDDDLVQLSKRRLYEEEAKRIAAERRLLEESNQSKGNKDDVNPQVAALQSTIDELKRRIEKQEETEKELRRKLEEAEKKRLEDTINSLRDEIRELRNEQNRLRNQYDVAIHMMDSVKDIIITGMKPIEVRERPQPKESARATPTEEELRMLGIPFEEE